MVPRPFVTILLLKQLHAQTREQPNLRPYDLADKIFEPASLIISITASHVPHYAMFTYAVLVESICSSRTPSGGIYHEF